MYSYDFFYVQILHDYRKTFIKYMHDYRKTMRTCGFNYFLRNNICCAVLIYLFVLIDTLTIDLIYNLYNKEHFYH